MFINKCFFRNLMSYIRELNWNNPNIRSFVYQFLVLMVFLFFIFFLSANVLSNLSSRNIVTGFDFIDREAGFSIGETIIKYSPMDSYFRAVLVGLANTFRIASIGIFLSTGLGLIIGIGRISKNRVLFILSSLYVEIIRNIPLLLQIFFWYSLITEYIPGPRQAINPIPGVFISNRGIKLPFPGQGLINYFLEILLISIFFTAMLKRWLYRYETNNGHKPPFLGFIVSALIFMSVIVSVYLINGSPTEIDIPVLNGFNFDGGITLSSEFTALLVGLVIYTAAFIAEVIRSGMQAVSHGQWEAAYSLGLRRNQILRLVIFPQARRIFIPPMISQYLNLTKNSSLAVAIGYPDIVSIVNTIINQTGQAIEGIVIILVAYLTVNLTISLLMNLYNKHIIIVEH